LNGIQVSGLEWAKGIVMNDPNERNNFIEAAQYINTILIQTKRNPVEPSKEQQAVSQVETKKPAAHEGKPKQSKAKVVELTSLIPRSHGKVLLSGPLGR
jgi:hypothetical protein